MVIPMNNKLFDLDLKFPFGQIEAEFEMKGINIKKEYELIKKKESKLSANQRKQIVKIMEKYKKEE